MADLLRLVSLEGPVLGLGMVVALVWLIVSVKGLDSKFSGLDSKFTALDSKVTSLATDVAVLRGRQDERDRQEQIQVNGPQLVRAIRNLPAAEK